MANLLRRKHHPTFGMRRSIDPFGEDLMAFAPRSLRRDLENLFNELVSNQPAAAALEFIPSLEVTERDNEYVMRVELPGMSDADVQVDIDEDNLLTIRGEKRHEETLGQAGAEYSERVYGQFVRTIQLPNAVDASKIEAKFENGILELTVPKAITAQKRSIPIGKGAPAEKAPTAQASQQAPQAHDGEKEQQVPSSQEAKEQAPPQHNGPSPA